MRKASTNPPRFLTHPLAPLIASLVLVSVAYMNACGGEFVFDDLPLVRDAGHIRSLDNVGSMFSLMAEDRGYGYRPVRTLTHMVEYRIWGLETWGYHLVNILLHALVCLLLYRLSRRLGLGEMASLAGMAIFAVHPVHTEAVTYISGRRDLLFTLFFLAGMLAYIRGVQEDRRWLVLAALPLFALSVFSKEQGITLPAVLYAWEVLVHRRAQPWPRRIWRPLAGQPVFWAVIWAGALGFFLYRGVLLPRTFHPHWWGGSPEANFATVLAVHLRYLVVLVWPANLLADYSPHAFPLARSFADWRTIASILAIAASLALAVRTARSHPLVPLTVASWWIMLLPVSHIIPHHELAAEHHLYLPSAGPCLAAGVGIVALARRRAWAGGGLLALVIVLMLGLTLSRNRDWHTAEALWGDTVEKAPRCGRALFNLAVVHVERGELDTGESLLRRALASTDIPRARAYLGDVLSKQGRHEEALEVLGRAYDRYPEDRFVIKYHALNLLRMDRPATAQDVLEKGIRTWPEDPDMHYLLGGCYLMAGRPGDALEQNLMVLGYRPGDEDARKIAIQIARKLGRSGLARKLQNGWTPQ